MSLLKHPSVAMSKLIQSVEKGSLSKASSLGLGERALQRPVMAFVMQRHDLESLQLAMRHSLRKAACRMYALQVSHSACPPGLMPNRKFNFASLAEAWNKHYK